MWSFANISRTPTYGILNLVSLLELDWLRILKKLLNMVMKQSERRFQEPEIFLFLFQFWVRHVISSNLPLLVLKREFQKYPFISRALFLQSFNYRFFAFSFRALQFLGEFTFNFAIGVRSDIFVFEIFCVRQIRKIQYESPIWFFNTHT